MVEASIGRLLVASLHQAIADLLPTRLEFYESWLNPSGLREGRIGLAQLAASLSFLRQEGAAYRLVAARAGEYAAEWTAGGVPAPWRSLLRALPRPVRLYLVTGQVRRMIGRTSSTSRAVIRWRRGAAAVNLRGSLFCEVRDRVDQPLCEFYASAIRRLMLLYSLDVDVTIGRCRATGEAQCLMTMLVRSAEADG